LVDVIENINKLEFKNMAAAILVEDLLLEILHLGQFRTNN
jgi:hypothetical protein